VGRVRRVLLAVDGSPPSQRAVEQAIALCRESREPQAMKVHLLNVQRPVSGDVASFVNHQTLDEYYTERSDAAMAPAKAALNEAGLAPEVHHGVGPPGATIAEVAQDQGCDLIVMGARGLGSHTAALLGSVAQGTIERAAVPVLVVK
jgi:nucleotide-binding universal stress UspA family protein